MGNGASLASLLRDDREEILRSVIESAPKEVPFYASIPEEMLRAIAARAVDQVLDQLTVLRPEAITSYALETFSRRRAQGSRFGEVIKVIHLIKRAVKKRVFRHVEDLVAAEEALEKVDRMFDLLVEAVAPVFESDLSQAEKTLAHIESRYRSLYQRTPAMMHSTDAEGRIQAVSDRWLETFGYAADEVLGKRSVDFLAPESRQEALTNNIPRLRREGQILEVPYQFVKKDGTTLDVRLSSIAIRDDHGDPTEFLAVFYDVTAELAATQRLRESEEHWRAVLELSPMSLTIHRDGVIVWVNRATMELLGATSAEQVIGHNALEFVHPDDRVKVIERMKQSASTSESLPALEERFMCFDGRVIHVEVAARPVMYEGKRATQLAAVDVTARRQMEETRRTSELQAQVIAAQEEALRALSTPLIPLGDGILVMPLVGRVNAERAERIVSTLAEGVVSTRATFAIVDVTGLLDADEQAMEALVRATDVVRLLGAEALITGIRPTMATTLLALGDALGRVVTRSTLRDGIGYAMTKRKRARA